MSPTPPLYGGIEAGATKWLRSPEPGWANTDVVTPLRAALHVPVALDTDVNAAALGEWRRGARRSRAVELGMRCLA
jgi:fructokinase